jgi:multidrug resistance efflux pump
MKNQNIRRIIVVSLLVMAIAVIISLVLEMRWQKLPAVVKADKVIVSSRVEGVVQSYETLPMHAIQKGAPLAKMVNQRLASKLQALEHERSTYIALIEHARQGGDQQLELLKCAQEKQKALESKSEAEGELQTVLVRLAATRERYNDAHTTCQAHKELYNNGVLSLGDYEKASKQYWDIHELYHTLRGDSVIYEAAVKHAVELIQILTTKERLLRQSKDDQLAKYQLKRDELDHTIEDVELQIANLTLVSPINGIVTDLSKRPGEEAERGDVIAEISDLDNIWITAYGNSFSTKKIQPGNKVKIYGNNGEHLSGVVRTISPVMEKVKALSSTFETVNAYSRIVIDFVDPANAMKVITPGERLFVRIQF